MGVTIEGADSRLSPQPPSSFCVKSKNWTALRTTSLFWYVFPAEANPLRPKNVPYMKQIPQKPYLPTTFVYILGWNWNSSVIPLFCPLHTWNKNFNSLKKLQKKVNLPRTVMPLHIFQKTNCFCQCNFYFFLPMPRI